MAEKVDVSELFPGNSQTPNSETVTHRLCGRDVLTFTPAYQGSLFQICVFWLIKNS